MIDEHSSFKAGILGNSTNTSVSASTTLQEFPQQPMGGPSRAATIYAFLSLRYVASASAIAYYFDHQAPTQLRAVGDPRSKATNQPCRCRSIPPTINAVPPNAPKQQQPQPRVIISNRPSSEFQQPVQCDAQHSTHLRLKINEWRPSNHRKRNQAPPFLFQQTHYPSNHKALCRQQPQQQQVQMPTTAIPSSATTV